MKIFLMCTKAIDKALKCILIIISLLMVFSAFAQVITREFFSSWSWTDELCRYCLVWLTFLATALGVKYKSHVRIDTLYGLVSPKFKTALDIFTDACALFFSIMIIKYGFPLCAQNMSQHSPSLKLPMGYVYSAVPLCGVLSIIFAAEDVLMKLSGKSQAAGGEKA